MWKSSNRYSTVHKEKDHLCNTDWHFYTDSFIHESVSCYGLLCILYVCSCMYVSITFVDHVQTDHRRNPILCIGAHL
jgi:hypothetical protein